MGTFLALQEEEKGEFTWREKGKEGEDNEDEDADTDVGKV